MRARAVRRAQRSSQSLSRVSPDARASVTAPTARIATAVASASSERFLPRASSAITPWSTLAKASRAASGDRATSPDSEARAQPCAVAASASRSR
jgi:hypothetical protein